MNNQSGINAVFQNVVSHLMTLAFLRFLIVGGSTAVIYFVLIYLTYSLGNINYNLSISIAYFSSVIFHFLANRRYTFDHHGHRLSKQVSRYISLLMLGYLTTLMIVNGAVRGLAFSPFCGALLAVGFNLVMNFFLMRFWVFPVH